MDEGTSRREPEEQRRAKRPRLNGPDGFEKVAKPPSKPSGRAKTFISAFETDALPKAAARRPIVPSTSAFEDVIPGDLTSKDPGKHQKLGRHPKPPVSLHRPNREIKSTFADLDAPTSGTTSSASKGLEKHNRPSSRPKSKFLLHLPRVQPPVRSNGEKQGTGSSILALVPQVAKFGAAGGVEESHFNSRPVLAVAEEAESSKRKTAISIFQPNFNLAPPTTREKHPLKPPPMPNIPSDKPVIPLKALVAPARPVTPASPQKNMKTILTTKVAQVTDPTKEGGNAELLSIFLQQHGHTYTSSVDRELLRGVGISPSKKSRAKGSKFVEGGLAQQADYIFSLSKTSQALWKRKKEQENELNKRVISDFRLSIMKLLRQARTADRPGALPLLALCRLTCRKNTTSDLVDTTYIVSFSTLGNDHTVRDFELGREVYIWPPWHTITLSSSMKSDLSSEIERDFSSIDSPRSMLVCTRYWITSKQGD